MKTNIARVVRGFSLVEMLVVISIIGILAAIAIPNIQAFNEKVAREKEEAAKKEQVQKQEAAKPPAEEYSPTGDKLPLKTD